MKKPKHDWLGPSKSPRMQKTLTRYTDSAMDNRDLKMRGEPTATEIYKKFIDTWQNGATLTDIAKTLGIPKHSASSRARELRSKGVELKKFPRHMPVDYAALNTYAKAAIKESPHG